MLKISALAVSSVRDDSELQSVEYKEMDKVAVDIALGCQKHKQRGVLWYIIIFEATVK